MADRAEIEWAWQQRARLDQVANILGDFGFLVTSRRVCLYGLGRSSTWQWAIDRCRGRAPDEILPPEVSAPLSDRLGRALHQREASTFAVEVDGPPVRQRLEVRLVPQTLGCTVVWCRFAPSDAWPSGAEGGSGQAQRLEALADTAPVLLWMSGKNGECEFFNRSWLDFRGRSLQQEIGMGWAEGVHPEDYQSCMHAYLEAFVERRRFAIEYRLRRHDGEYRWIYDQGAPRFDLSGGFAGFIGSCVDSTLQRERREALAALNAELECRVRERSALVVEHELMVREVHHRVKNHLQLVSTLLDWEGSRLERAVPAELLERCQARVSAFAQVHEHLHQTSQLDRVVLGDHLRELVAQMSSAGPIGGAARIEFVGEPGITLDGTRALPCTIIVQELVINALKHAFPGGAGGIVRVTCVGEGRGGVRVTVEDDGVGLPSHFEVSRSGDLGWTLVRTFARQLGARLEVGVASKGRGAKVAIVLSSPRLARSASERPPAGGRGETRATRSSSLAEPRGRPRALCGHVAAGSTGVAGASLSPRVRRARWVPEGRARR